MIPVLNAAILANDPQSYMSTLVESNILHVIDQMCCNRLLVLHIVHKKRRQHGQFVVEECRVPSSMSALFHWTFTNPRKAPRYLQDYQELLYYCNGCVKQERYETDLPTIGVMYKPHEIRPVIDFRRSVRNVPKKCVIIKINI